MEPIALASFEFSLSKNLPGKSLARNYFVVSDVRGKVDQLLCDTDGTLCLLTSAGLECLKAQVQHPASHEQYLGHNSQQAFWVVAMPASTLRGNYQWLGLRAQLGQVDATLFSLAGRALQICQWYFDHAYCGRCGQPTKTDQVDSARVCLACQLRFYPRISPCMIVLVVRDQELLLAHHVRASRPVYTTLAGFVEAGERVEDTVHREVYEEVGVRLGQLEYITSQSWPFPGQLMLGFIAEYASGDIQIDGEEILDANWFRYDQLPQVPPKATVAGQLIDLYVQRCLVKQLPGKK